MIMNPPSAAGSYQKRATGIWTRLGTRADARLLCEVDDHPLVRLVRNDQVDGADEGSGLAVGMRQGL
ncbi:MAG: hypothetical protein OXG35_34290, partial [Acidobacteria bacterium]|nr:hypothetical protein [Acidobacteriota bacterium]